MENNKIDRDYYLDTVKGLLVIGIVFIHTVFWSGSSYIPKYMQNIALSFDVPLFFFITGCVFSIHKNLNPLKQMYKLALIFFFGVLISQICFLHISLPKLIQTIYFTNANIPKLQVVAGSYWFVPVYIVSLLYAKIIISYFKKFLSYIAIIGIPIFYIATWFANKTTSLTVLGNNIQMVLFYIWLILIGYELYKYRGKKFWIYFCCVIAILLGLIFYHIPNLYFQNYKFPVQLPYIILSLLSISLVLFFYKKTNSNAFSKIGQNALYYYFSQGVGASLAFYIAKLPIDIWQLKFLACFCVNFFITISLGYIISLAYPKIEKLVIK